MYTFLLILLVLDSLILIAAVLLQAGKGEHPKSFSLAWMREHALHVYTARHPGDMCDYLPKLLEDVTCR